MENGKKQYRTAGLDALLRYLQKNTTGTPQTAGEIWCGVRGNAHAPGQSSVYRLLARLTDAGTVRRSRVGGAYVYQFVGEHADCSRHLHLQCLTCGRVCHLKCDCNEEISSHLRKTHGFLVDSGRSVLLGTCAVCAQGGE